METFTLERMFNYSPIQEVPDSMKQLHRVLIAPLYSDVDLKLALEAIKEITTLSEEAIALLPGWAIRRLGKRQVVNINPARLSAKQFAALTNQQLYWLSPRQIGQISLRQLALLDDQQRTALFAAIEPHSFPTPDILSYLAEFS